MKTPDELTKLVQTFFPSHAISIAEHLLKENSLFKLSNNMIYLTCKDLDLDTDGSNLAGDWTCQNATSLRDIHGHYLNANIVPYFVLPGHWDHNIKLGDYGVIWTDNAVSGFICGDIGPRAKIGEGSLELHRRLGAERVRNNKVIDCSLGKPFRALLFPNSNNGGFRNVESLDQRVESLLLTLKEPI